MKSEKNSPLLNLPDNRPYNQYIQNPVQKNIASNNPSFNLEEKNKEQEKDINIQDEQTNFNISFFLPKELRENIEGDEANSEKEINNNNIAFFDLEKKNNNINNNFDASKNNNNKYFSLKQNSSTPYIQNNIDNFGIHKKDNFFGIKNNNYNAFPNGFQTISNFNEGKNYMPANTNINNIIINSNNNPINFEFYTNPLFDNKFYQPNFPNLLVPKIPNNLLLYNFVNNPINNNINNINLNNNNNFSIMYLNNQNKNIQNNQNNNKKKKKRVIDEYTIEMFGRIGWICELCNNFNYDTRKKCNRCHINKKAKKIEEYLLAEKNKNNARKNLWYCKYCGNYNYAFRIICNRCQAKKDII